jgi:phosphatidyl-myo-inositol dimannoside synthase
MKSLTTVLVHQGSPGGIGQVELLLDSAFAAFGGRTVVVSRQVAPAPTREPAGRISKIPFGLRVLEAVIGTQPDLVLFTHLSFASLAPLVRAMSFRCRAVCIAHGIEAWRPITPSTRLGMQALDAVWCVSEFTRGMLHRESQIAQSKLHVLPLALSDAKSRLIESHSQRESAGRVSKPFELLTVTRLDRGERYKGVEHVLACLKHVRSLNENFTYRLIGDGTDRARLQSLADCLGMTDVVTFDGAASDREVAQRLGACNAFILPSAKEGFGLAHLEAMCASKPVIAAIAGATPEVVDDASGLLTRYGDTEGLAEAILRLMNDATLRAALGGGGRSRFQDRFTEATFRLRLLALVEAL